jgi:hypothetical protein
MTLKELRKKALELSTQDPSEAQVQAWVEAAADGKASDDAMAKWVIEDIVKRMRAKR